MHDLRNFTLRDMTLCGSALRKMGDDATTMEEVAGRIVRHLYGHFVDTETGEPACALVRFFKTHSFQGLDEDLREIARGMLGDDPESPAMKSLILLASAGVRPEWNDRRSSAGHRAIPLASERMVERFPMISNLVKEFGLDVAALLDPDPDLLLSQAQTSYHIFHVPRACGSPFVPAQEGFVVPFGIESVLGFGGVLPAGDLFAIIIFSKVPIPRETADMFRTLALCVKVAALPFERRVLA